MKKKTIIWHTPKEKLPESGKVVLFLVPDDGICMGKYWEDINRFQDYYMDDFEYTPDDITEWAYVEQVIAASKALDVAIEALKIIKNTGDRDGQIAADWLDLIYPEIEGGK